MKVVKFLKVFGITNLTLFVISSISSILIPKIFSEIYYQEPFMQIIVLVFISIGTFGGINGIIRLFIKTEEIKEKIKEKEEN